MEVAASGIPSTTEQLFEWKEHVARDYACLPFTQGKRSVYRLGRFGQMVSKFPYWENSVRDWRLPFAEIPTIYQKNCMTATANEKVAKQKLWLTKQRLCTCVIFCIFLCRSVHNYNVKWPNSTTCVEHRHSTVNFRCYDKKKKLKKLYYVSSDLAPCKDGANWGESSFLINFLSKFFLNWFAVLTNSAPG